MSPTVLLCAGLLLQYAGWLVSIVVYVRYAMFVWPAPYAYWCLLFSHNRRMQTSVRLYESAKTRMYLCQIKLSSVIT